MHAERELVTDVENWAEIEASLDLVLETVLLGDSVVIVDVDGDTDTEGVVETDTVIVPEGQEDGDGDIEVNKLPVTETEPVLDRVQMADTDTLKLPVSVSDDVADTDEHEDMEVDGDEEYIEVKVKNDVSEGVAEFKVVKVTEVDAEIVGETLLLTVLFSLDEIDGDIVPIFDIVTDALGEELSVRSVVTVVRREALVEPDTLKVDVTDSVAVLQREVDMDREAVPDVLSLMDAEGQFEVDEVGDVD